MARTCVVTALLLTGGASGCGTHHRPEGPPDAALERRVIGTTAPDSAVQITFGWSAVEREGRFSGQGVARIEPGYRARLDLFGPRGDTYLSAALVEGDVRLPPVRQPATLPPPAFMWGVLGVVAPPERAELLASGRTGDGLVLEYADGEGRLRYLLVEGVLHRVRWDGPGDRRLTVELDQGTALGVPRRARYRDWTAFVELTLTLEEAEYVDGFPPEIWYPGAP